MAKITPDDGGQRSNFCRAALANLKKRAEGHAKQHPTLRHMLVLPEGETLFVPARPGSHPLGGSSYPEPPAVSFGDSQVLAALPPAKCWPPGLKPIRAVVAEPLYPVRPPAGQRPYRVHLFFGDAAGMTPLQSLAADLVNLAGDVARAVFGAHEPDMSTVFFRSSDYVHGKDAEILDAWLCTVHWWAWKAIDSPIHTRPLVVFDGSAITADRRDQAVVEKMSFSALDCDIFTATAATIDLFLRFLDLPPDLVWPADYPPVQGAVVLESCRVEKDKADSPAGLGNKGPADGPAPLSLAGDADHVPDFTLPYLQNEPSCAAILDFLRRLTPHFLPVSGELTDAEWTAFRALAKKGAAEGILRIVCTPEHATEAVTEYHHIQGDYVNAMIPGFIRRDRPIDDRLVQARLTARGQRLAGVLQLEKTDDAAKVRAAVLEMLWRKPIKLGSDHMIPLPDAATLTAADVAQERVDSQAPAEAIVPQSNTGTVKDASNRLRLGPKPEVNCEDKTCRYLREHASRDDITCREIADEIGYSSSAVAKTKAWQAYQNLREKDAELRRKKLSNNQGMDDDFVGKQ